MIAAIEVGSCRERGSAPDFSGTEPTVAGPHQFWRLMPSASKMSECHRKGVGSVPAMRLRLGLPLALTAHA